MRSEVADSWRRSAAAGVDVDSTDSVITLPTDTLLDYREAHPLSQVFPLLEEVLGEAAKQCDALLALSDEAGQLLWISGSSATLRRAERVGFVEGANWDERLVGTNAPGTALTLGRPVVVTEREHYRALVRSFSCVASPIHDPVSRSIIGVLDITGGPAVAVPQSLAMVRAAARLAEAELAKHAREASLPAGMRLLDIASGGRLGLADFHLEGLGRRAGVLSRGGRSTTLSPRHTEIMVVLSGAPRGLSGDELAMSIYPHDVTASTMRAEMNRLRHLVGEDVVESRPYRLSASVAGDWHAVQAHLAAGSTSSALRDYLGPLLPYSQAPGVEELREQVQNELRHAVLRSGRADLMAVWTRSSWGSDDYEMWSAQQRQLPAGSALQPLVRAQLARLDRDYAVSPVPGRRPVGGSSGSAQV